MPIALLVAESENHVIGRDGQMPWRLSADLRRFKQLTMGHTIIMGRKTYESIGRLLPGRKTVIVTRQADYRVPGAEVVSDLAQALACQDDWLFVVGGGEIYRQALPHASRVYRTVVHEQLEGDTFFPPLDAAQWHCIERTPHPADDRNSHPCTFEVWDRVTTSA